MEKLKGIPRRAGNVYNKLDKGDQKRRPDFLEIKHTQYVDVYDAALSDYELPPEIENMSLGEILDIVRKIRDRAIGQTYE